MILQILLLFLYNILVSANTDFPAQTYPIYQQNGYANPSANQANDITPYLQALLGQNQSPPSNLSPSDIRQILLNRILSSPSMQTILDPSLSGYGSYLNENPNNQIVSNPGNNYFGVPSEHFNNNMRVVNAEDVVTEAKTRKKAKQSKRRSSKSRRKHDNVEKHENSSRKNIKTNNSETEHVSKKAKRKSKKSSRNQNTIETTIKVNEQKNNENESNKKPKTRRKKKKGNVQNKNENGDEKNNIDDSKPRRRHRKQKTQKDKIDKVISDEKSEKAETEIIDGINLAHFNDGIIEENRVTRNPIQEGNDIPKLFPNMPEDVANNFLTGLPQMNNPLLSNFFSNYENIYQSMMTKNNMEINDLRVKRRRKSKKNKNKLKKKNGESITNSTQVANLPVNSIQKTIVVDPKADSIVTTERIYLNERTKTNINLNLKDEGIKLIDKTSEINKEMIEVTNNEELRNEHHEDMPSNFSPAVNGLNQNHDKDNLNNGYIDDYYPLFTDNAAYNANLNEVYIKNLSDDKYFYATDMGSTDFINKRKFVGYDFPERVLKDYEINKQYTDTERESIKNVFKDRTKQEIKFRSPPLLESPDFQTRKVERSEITPELYYIDTNDNEINRFSGHKSSSYSDVKTPYYPGVKHTEIISPKDKAHKDVETVFARSKVATYGPVYRSEEDNSNTGTQSNSWTGDGYDKDGGTTYVLAKSLEYPEFFW